MMTYTSLVGSRRDLVGRYIEPRLRAALQRSPVVALQGARQVGKSTLARAIVGDLGGEFVSLDDPLLRAAAERDPQAFIDRPGLLCIDEIQRVPDLLLAIKLAVDERRVAGRFLVTGSADLRRLRSVRDSLAGRIERIVLHGFTQGELERTREAFLDAALAGRLGVDWTSSLSRASYLARAGRGGFPEAVARDDEDRVAWLESYVADIVERDLPEIAGRHRLGVMPRLVSILAAGNARERNIASLARTLDIGERALPAYLELLELLYLVVRIPAWSADLGRRLIARPKLFLADPGLAAAVAGLTPERLSPRSDPRPAGALLEGFVVTELVRQSSYAEARVTLHHFRDRGGDEVDVVAEHRDGRVVAIEVKAGAAPADAVRSLVRLRDRLGERFVLGVVLSTDQHPARLGDRLLALPIEALWRDTSRRAAA